MAKFFWGIVASLASGLLLGIVYWTYISPALIRFFH